MSQYMPSKNNFSLRVVVAAIAALVSAAVFADTPDARLITAPLVDPGAGGPAWTYYSGLGAAATTHTTGLAAWPSNPPEITALARTLGADRLTPGVPGYVSQTTYIQNVFNYVRSNIAVEYRFGLGKGARGALIDQSGTPFDQAELMVKLLRVPTTPSTISASFIVGTATLTAQQFAQWTGIANDLSQPPASLTVNAAAACQFMADGGVPVSCSPSTGNLSSITFAHIWVSVNGNLYDPSFKEHTLKAGIDLPNAMGCGTAASSTCGQTVTNVGMTGATQGTLAGSSYIQNFRFYDLELLGNPTAPTAALGLSANLANSILTQGRLWQVQDVVGGKVVSPSVITSFTSLPYSSTVQLTWTGAIPDAFRSTLTITPNGGCSSLQFFADEIANRRLSFTGGDGYAGGLFVDGMVTVANITISPCTSSSTAALITISVNHPYAASSGTYADDITNFNLVEDPSYETGIYGCPPFQPLPGVGGQGGSGTGAAYPLCATSQPEHNMLGSAPFTIVHAFGEQSTSAQHFMSDLVSASPVLANTTTSDCKPSTSTWTLGRTCSEDAQATAAETIGPYRTLMGRIVSGVTGTAITRHHDVGVVFSSRFPGLMRVTMHEAESVNSRTADSAARTRAFEIEAAVLTTVEGAGASGDPNSNGDFASYFTWQMAGGKGTRVFDVAPGNMASLLTALPNAFASWRQNQLQAAANNGYETIIPEGGDAEIFLNTNSRAYTIWENLKGAAAPADPIGGAMRTADIVDTASIRRKEYSISEADGSLTFQAPPDIVTGTGDFPYSLPFARTFKPAVQELVQHQAITFMQITGGQQGAQVAGGDITLTQHSGWDAESHARLGGGWTHNYNVTANFSGDAAKGLGEDFALEASTAIAGVVILNDLLSNPTLANRLATVSTLHELSYGLYANVFIVKKGPSAETFIALPGQLFNTAQSVYVASDGSSARVTCAPAALVPVQYPNGIRGGKYVAGACTYSGTTGDRITFYRSFSHQTYNFSQGGTVGVGIGSVPPLLVGDDPIYAATSWVFPSGIRLDFEYKWVNVVSSSSPVYDCDPTAVLFTGYCTGGAYGWALTRVSNNLGRSLTFNTVGQSDPNGFWYAWMIQSVTDETGRRSATFSTSSNGSGNCHLMTSCDVFTATDPTGKISRYEYTTDANSPDPTVIEKPNYRLRRWYTPGSGTTPYAIFNYDELYRIKTISQLVSGTTRRVTTYYPGGVAGTERHKFAYTVMPDNAVYQKLFDQHNNLVWSTDPLGRTTTTTFDNANHPLITTYPERNSTQNAYDIRGNVLSVTQLLKPGSTLTSNPTTTVYSEGPTVFNCVNPVTCNKPISEQDPKGAVSNYTWNATNGNLMQILLPADNSGNRPQTDFSYTAYTSTSDPTGTPFTLLTSKTERVTASPLTTRVTSYAYNASNKYVLQSATVDPSGLNLTTTLAFDAVGNLQTVDGPLLLGTPDLTTYYFDPARRITRIDAPLGAIKRYTYDDDGDVLTARQARQATVTDTNKYSAQPTDLVGSQWQTTTKVYNVGGDLLSVKDDEGNQTTYAYDNAGRAVVVTDPDLRQVATIFDAAGQTSCTWRGEKNWTAANVPEWDATAWTTACNWTPSSYTGSGAFRYGQYAYTGNGKQATVQDADNNTTQYVYDGLDRLRLTLFPNAADGALCTGTSPDNSTPVCTASNGTTPTYEQYSYDANNNRTNIRTRNNQNIGSSYDALNRLFTKSPANQGQVSYSYNLINLPLTVNKAAAGSLAAHTTTYGYDTAGRKSNETNEGRQVAYQYWENGSRKQTTWPDGYFVTYAIDGLGRMTNVYENSTTSNELAYYNYDTLSRRNYLCVGGTGASCRSNGTGVTNATNYTYEPDSDLGNLTQVLSSTTVSLGYTHNHSHQLTNITASDTFYLAKPVTTATNAYVPNSLNEYSSVGGQAFTYDANGNLLTSFPPNGSGKQTYTYDSENRLSTAAVNGSSVVTVNYDYDALGRRVQKTVGTTITQYLLDGDEEIAEYNGSTLLRRYITGPATDDRIARAEGNAITNPNPPKYYYHTNHQGSVIAMTDNTGSTACSGCQLLAYDEYGKLTSAAVSSGEQFRYTGRRFDPETNLYYYRARYYSPDLGRFLQTDPIGYKDDLDLYTYVGDDPLDKTDPTGLMTDAGNGLAWIDAFPDLECHAAGHPPQNTGGPEITLINDNPKGASPNQPVTYAAAFLLETAVVESGVQSVNINSTTGGRHDPHSNHPKGQAFDINKVNGKPVSPNGSKDVANLQNALAKQPTSRENFGPAGMSKKNSTGGAAHAVTNQKLTDDHRTHIHASVQDSGTDPDKVRHLADRSGANN